MKKILLGMMTTAILLVNACHPGQTQPANTELQATEFSERIENTPSAIILDVRTPEEFEKGHLSNAINIDWNGKNFEDKLTVYDKAKPVFVYCLSGVRSAAAAANMRSSGFKEVYELTGGILKWRASNLPETKLSANTGKGMSLNAFREELKTDKLVLVDYYADWCAPCKKMKLYLDEISQTMNDKVKVIRINTDDNQSLCRELKIDELPSLQLYKNNLLIWTNVGYIGKDEVISHLR